MQGLVTRRLESATVGRGEMITVDERAMTTQHRVERLPTPGSRALTLHLVVQTYYTTMVLLLTPRCCKRPNRAASLSPTCASPAAPRACTP
jgi:hypothetical protein